nr:Bm7911 [Brugia malayi]
MRTSGRRLLPPRSLRRRRRSSQRYLRSRLYGRLRHVNSGRIKGRSFKTFT